MDFFGLDIGSENLKLAQLEKAGPRFKLVTLATVPAPKSIESEAETDLVVIATAIKKMVGEAKVTTKNVVASLPEDKIFTRIVELPWMEEKELKSAIRWEADQYVPIPLAEAVLDYQLLDAATPTRKGKVRVFLVAAPKELVEKYIKVLEMAGLKPVGLETEMISFCRSLVLASNQATILVDLGARSADIALVQNGQILLTRSIASAGRAITRALVSSLGLQSAQAEEYKKTYGIDGKKFEGKIKQAMDPIFQAVVMEIKKVISFYKTETAVTSEIERIILTGGTAQLPEAVGFLAQQLGQQVELGDPFQRIDSAKEPSAKMEKGAGVFYAGALGLAMKEI